MKQTIIFDLDGTLADTGPDLLAALNHSTAPCGLKPLQREHLGVLVGHGILAMIERAFHLQNQPLPEATRKKCQSRFLEFYTNNIANETVLFDGARQCLDMLKTSGYGLAVCTNKREDLARQLIAGLNLAEMFSAISGGNSFAFCKPDGRHLLETVKLASGDPKATIMVGDTITDITAAKDAGIPVIAVDFGYSDVPVESLNADIVISHFNQLVDAIARINITIENT